MPIRTVSGTRVVTLYLDTGKMIVAEPEVFQIKLAFWNAAPKGRFECRGEGMPEGHATI